MSDKKILFRRGLRDDLPELQSGEIGIATDYPHVAIGADSRYGSSIANRSVFPYQNVEILTDQSTDLYRNMHMASIRSGNDLNHFTAVLQPDIINSTTVRVDDVDFVIPVMNKISAFIQYSIVNNKTGRMTRTGDVMIQGDEVIVVSDTSSQNRDISGGQNTNLSASHVFGKVMVEFVRIGNELLMQYRNHTFDHQILRFNISTPSDAGIITQINSIVDINPLMEGESAPPPDTNKLWKIGGTDSTGNRLAFGNLENSFTSIQALTSTESNVITATRIYASNPTSLGLSLTGSAIPVTNRFMASDHYADRTTALQSRTILSCFDNDGEILWHREITGSGTINIRDINIVNNRVMAVMDSVKQSGEQYGGIIDLSLDGTGQIVTRRFNEPCVRMFQVGTDTIAILNRTVKRKSASGSDTWFFNLTGSTRSVTFVDGYLSGNDLYVLGTILAETVLLKINAQTGAIVWNRTFSPTNMTNIGPLAFPRMVNDVSGSYVMRFHNDVLYMTKIDHTGNVAWSRTVSYPDLPFDFKIGILDDRLVIAAPIGNMVISLIDKSTGEITKNIIYTDAGDIRRVNALSTDSSLSIAFMSSSPLDDRMNYSGIVRLPLDVLDLPDHHNHLYGKAFNVSSNDGTPRYGNLQSNPFVTTPYDGLIGIAITSDNYESAGTSGVSIRNGNFPIEPSVYSKQDRKTTAGEFWISKLMGVQIDPATRDILIPRAIRIVNSVIYVAVDAREPDGGSAILLYRIAQDGSVLSSTRIPVNTGSIITGMVVGNVVSIFTNYLDKIDLTLSGTISATRELSGAATIANPVLAGNNIFALLDEGIDDETIVGISPANVIMAQKQFSENDPDRATIVRKDIPMVSRNNNIYIPLYTSGPTENTAARGTTITKTNQALDILWRRRFGALSGDFVLNDQSVDIADNLYLIGKSTARVVILKLDPMGNKLWCREYDIADYSGDHSGISIICSDARVFAIVESHYDQEVGRTYMEIDPDTGDSMWGRSFLPSWRDRSTNALFDVSGSSLIEVSCRDNVVEITRMPLGADTDVDDDGDRQWVVSNIAVRDHIGITISSGTTRIENGTTIAIGPNNNTGTVTADLRNNISTIPLD